MNARNSDSAQSPFPKWRKWLLVLILGGLLAILFSWLSQASRGYEGNDMAAASNLRNALAAAKTIFARTDDYSGVSTQTLSQEAPEWKYKTGDVAGTYQISWSVQTTNEPKDTVDLAAWSYAGICYYAQ